MVKSVPVERAHVCVLSTRPKTAPDPIGVERNPLDDDRIGGLFCVYRERRYNESYIWRFYCMTKITLLRNNVTESMVS